jgi:hypothetical protein
MCKHLFHSFTTKKSVKSPLIVIEKHWSLRYSISIDDITLFRHMTPQLEKAINLHFFWFSLSMNSCPTCLTFSTALILYTSVVVHQIRRFRFSDDDDTPQRTDRFAFCGLILNGFTHLQSLSSHLLHLTHLHMSECRVLNTYNIEYDLLNSI